MQRRHHKMAANYSETPSPHWASNQACVTTVRVRFLGPCSSSCRLSAAVHCGGRDLFIDVFLVQYFKRFIQKTRSVLTLLVSFSLTLDICLDQNCLQSACEPFCITQPCKICNIFHHVLNLLQSLTSFVTKAPRKINLGVDLVLVWWSFHLMTGKHGSKELIMKFYFEVVFIFGGLFTFSRPARWKQAGPFPHTLQKKTEPDSQQQMKQSESFSSPHLLCIKKKKCLRANLSQINKAECDVENYCFSLWFEGRRDRNWKISRLIPAVLRLRVRLWVISQFGAVESI